MRVEILVALGRGRIEDFSWRCCLFQLSQSEICSSERTILAVSAKRSAISGQRRGFLY